MINLLPPQRAAAIRYGRQNSTLRFWLLGAAGAVLGLVIILGSGWIYLDHQSRNLQKNINETNQQLQAENIDRVKADAKEITGDINVIDKVLGQEIHFSDLIQTIGSYMPPGAVLGSLSLRDQVSGALDLSANSIDYASAAQIAVNLSDQKDNLFSRVDIVNISCGSDPQKTYKCSATLRALFSQSAQTRFTGLASGDQL